ncbi:MAG: protein jag [Clostridium sp.]|nr:protein jag [Clostridium sp.]
MDYKEFKAKTVDEAITAATIEFGVTSSELDYEIVEKGSSGFLGIGAKPAVIKARKKNEKTDSNEDFSNVSVNEKSAKSKKETKKVSVGAGADTEIVKKTKEYLNTLFHAMKIETEVTISFDEESNNMSIDLEGPEMGILIGKRGQTLDSLQYLISLFVNKESESYIRVKLDTENYRARRKDTLENLAKNIAYKVKRNRRSITLEPMNPYERRIIHSALQNDKYVATRSEGEEPYRKVVVYLKK